MGFFSDIKDKIFHRQHQEPVTAAPAGGASAAPAAPKPQPTVAQASPASPAPQSTSAPATPSASTTPTATPTAGQAAAPASASTSQVDVAAILDQAVASSGQQLNWRTSIVDLMKALGIDSSLSARKELAKELDYTGSTDDSATMNIWLHKQVLQKLAANGGTVPADLLD